MRHAIICRGQERVIEQIEPGPRSGRQFKISGYDGSIFYAHWNGLPFNGLTWSPLAWAQRGPCFLPIATLVCDATRSTADYDEARSFASAIIDGPDMEAVANIACDWIEARESDWPIPKIETDIGLLGRHLINPPRRWITLSEWCRKLIDDRCLTCGGQTLRYLQQLGLPDRPPVPAPDACRDCGFAGAIGMPDLAVIAIPDLVGDRSIGGPPLEPRTYHSRLLRPSTSSESFK